MWTCVRLCGAVQCDVVFSGVVWGCARSWVVMVCCVSCSGVLLEGEGALRCVLWSGVKLCEAVGCSAML